MVKCCCEQEHAQYLAAGHVERGDDDCVLIPPFRDENDAAITCMHAWIHTYMDTYIHAYTHTYVLPAYMHTYMHTCMHACIRITCIHTHIHACMHACILDALWEYSTFATRALGSLNPKP